MKAEMAGLVLVCLIFGVPLMGHFQSNEARLETFSYINTMGFELIECEIDSPSIIIPVDDVSDLLDKAWELNATTIYTEYVYKSVGSRRAYFVFNEDHSIAWRAYA